MLVDSHCHLNDKKFDKDRAAVIRRAREAGITAMVCIGFDVESSRQAVDIANSNDGVYAAIGVHPHDAKTVKPRDIDGLARMADSAKVVAVGEIGLDYYRDLSPRNVQQAAFREQLELARSLKVPVVIHARNADEETFGIITEYQKQASGDWPKDRPLGIMHCFAGDLPLALRYIELGFVISIPTTITYPNAERTRAVARGIPLRWMAVETDAPYLAPQSIRGKRNEPAHVVDAVECIAEVRGAQAEEVADGTAMSAAWLFGLGDIGEPAAAGRPVGEARGDAR
jgi:TatD DNase family protein